MKKRVYFSEAVPEPMFYYKDLEIIDGTVVSETPWKVSEKYNGDSQKILTDTNNSREIIVGITE